MRKLLISLITCSFLLTSCSFLSSLSSGGSSQQQEDNKIESFEFVTDSNMKANEHSDGRITYQLDLYVGDTYQLHTDVDDKIGKDYYFEYSDYSKDKLSISSTGFITTLNKGVESVKTLLIRKKDSRRIDYKYFIINIKEPNKEYADITIDDATLDYDEASRTYSLSLKSEESYYIPTSIKYNVPYNKVFTLSDESYSSFMNVSASGHITTSKANEDKDGQVTIKTVSTDNTQIYDTVYLNVHIVKSDDITVNTFKVINASTGLEIKADENISLFVNESLSFLVKYNDVNEYNVMSISNEEVLSLDNETNTIKALKEGTSNVTFSYLDKSLSVQITVNKNLVTEIYSKNEAEDFVIVNNNLLFLGRMFAKYQSGLEVDITKSNNLSYKIANYDASYKEVTFSYIEDEVTVKVTYKVLYFEYEEYNGVDTAYSFKDYFENHYSNKCYLLPKEGVINMLVIPVWFTNSTTFFKEEQQTEILEDLEYVFNTYREEDGFHSVKQFYEIESNNKLTLNINISEFYESGTSSRIYGDTLENDLYNTYSLADSAITWYFENHLEESFSDYDLNNDGLIDALSLVYAANYYGRIGDANGTVAFQFKNTNGSSAHKYNNASFSPIGGIYGFNKNSDPANQLEATDLSKYYPSYYFESGCRTIIHETGHMFGFMDLYEDNHAEVKYFPAGRFSMQSSNLGGHDPYQMNLVGWSKPVIYSASNYEVGEEIKVSIKDFATTGNNILLTKEMNENNSLFDEYMLLELLAPTGLNKYDAKNSSYKFSNPGIRLWHVDSILEDLSSGGKETTEIANNVTNLKYSNNDQSSESDLAHWIRNNTEEAYDTVSSVKDSYGLFMKGDYFSMDKYQSQFINKDKLDNKEKLGWEFKVDSIYQTIDDEYGAVITLIRVENTRTDFDFSSRVDKDVATQPSIDGEDYALELFGDNELFSLVYNYNDATVPGYYTQGKPISYKGLCLFAASNSNGGSLVISIKDKEGYIVKINSISITHTMLTKASLTVLVDDNEITGTSFTGPYNNLDEYNEKGLTFELDSKTVTLQNRYNGNIDYWSVLAIYSISINYHIEKI